MALLTALNTLSLSATTQQNYAYRSAVGISGLAQLCQLKTNELVTTLKVLIAALPPSDPNVVLLNQIITELS